MRPLLPWYSRLRRAERGQSALAECAILLPTYVVLIFGVTTFGQMGLLKKKAVMSARYVAFGGTGDDVKKDLLLDKWEKLEFGGQKVKVTIGTTSSIEYTPMKVMIKNSSSGTAGSGGNPLNVRGGLDENLKLEDNYSVDGS